MRRLIRFPCADAMLSGSFDAGSRNVGLLCVTGGSQVRTGPHRMLHLLARAVVTAGFPVLRYDRRGVGDSDGDDAGYRSAGPDLAAAASALRAQAPHVTTLVGFGLCDGATTLALGGSAAGVDAMVLANPWLVEVEEGDVAPAAAREHYRTRLLSRAAWRSVLGGKVDLIAAARSLLGALTRQGDRTLADDVAAGFAPYRSKLVLILSRGDNTAIAARACWEAEAFSHVRGERVVTIDTDAHTFARTGDLDQVTQIVIGFLHDLESRG